MRGTIQKKGKRWYAVIYDGVNPGTGNYKRRWVPAGTRRSDAERLLTDLLKRHNEGVPVATDRITLGDYLTERWLPIQQARLRASAFESSRMQIERYVVPASRMSTCSTPAFLSNVEQPTLAFHAVIDGR